MDTEKKTIHILVVDDEQGLRDLLKVVLEMEAYQVVTACNGVEALAAMDKQLFRLVITDVMMPQMDGIRLLEEIKKKGAHTEVIVATGYGDANTTDIALQKGAYDCILKPYNIDKIVALTSAALTPR